MLQLYCLFAMKHFSTLAAYCRGINISNPKWADFDLRSFEDNMKTVHHQMPPFKHEFYAIAIKLSGGGTVKVGNFETTESEAVIFFNSPYQILSWDIPPDWKGFYAIFTEDFYRSIIHAATGQTAAKRLTDQFSFLLMDKTIPMDITEADRETFLKIFLDIEKEFRQNTMSSKEIIAHYIHILLLKINRLYQNYQKKDETAPTTQTQRSSDVEVVNRFKSLLELSFRPDKEYRTSTPHQVQHYAQVLNLHPSHFNAIIKRITDIPASEHIQNHIFSLAKSQLTQTTTSVKEIAYGLYYAYPNHFTNFFKKRAKMTPSQYRKSQKQ